ncbi:pleiotropic regulator 1-like [Sylvia borin]
MAADPQQQWQRDIGSTRAGEVHKHCVNTLGRNPLKRTYDTFVADYGPNPLDEESHRVKRAVKLHTEYVSGLPMPTVQENLREEGGPSSLWDPRGHKEHSGDQGPVAVYEVNAKDACSSGALWQSYCTVWRVPSESAALSSAVAPPAFQEKDGNWTAAGAGDVYRQTGIFERSHPPGMSVPMGESHGYRNSAFMPKEAATRPKPRWHPPWELHGVMRAHRSRLRCIAVEPGNQWFASGSVDGTINIWDLANGELKSSLLKHFGIVRGMVVSARRPYLFSCGEKGQVMCWDVEYGKVVGRYRGHRDFVGGLDLHPTIDVLVTCGRDTTVRVWDIRTKASVQTLLGHTYKVTTVKCHAAEPQIISGSHDTTIRLWDLTAGKTRVTLTNHKKSVRAIVLHPRYYTFASGGPDIIKQWEFPDGNFIQNLTGHYALINTLAVNSDDVLVSGAGDGSIHFWDWTTGQRFQHRDRAVPLRSSRGDPGIYACAFDQSGTRLLVAEGDKTIKIYREDDTVTEEYHPVRWKPGICMRKYL